MTAAVRRELITLSPLDSDGSNSIGLPERCLSVCGGACICKAIHQYLCVCVLRFLCVCVCVHACMSCMCVPTLYAAQALGWWLNFQPCLCQSRSAVANPPPPLLNRPLSGSASQTRPPLLHSLWVSVLDSAPAPPLSLGQCLGLGPRSSTQTLGIWGAAMWGPGSHARVL